MTVTNSTILDSVQKVLFDFKKEGKKERNF